MKIASIIVAVLVNMHIIAAQQESKQKYLPPDIVFHEVLPYLVQNSKDNPSKLWLMLLILDKTTPDIACSTPEKDALIREILFYAEGHLHKFGQDKSGLLTAFVTFDHLSPEFKEYTQQIIRRTWRLNPLLLKINTKQAFKVEQDLRTYCMSEFSDEYTYEEINHPKSLEKSLVLSTHTLVDTKNLRVKPLRAYTDFYESQSYYKAPGTYEVGGTYYRTITKPSGMYNCYVLPPSQFIYAEDGLPYDNLNKYFVVDKEKWSFKDQKEHYYVFPNDTSSTSKELLCAKINFLFKKKPHVQQELDHLKSVARAMRAKVLNSQTPASPKDIEKAGYIDFFLKSIEKQFATMPINDLPVERKDLIESVAKARSYTESLTLEEWWKKNRPKECIIQ